MQKKILSRGVSFNSISARFECETSFRKLFHRRRRRRRRRQSSSELEIRFLKRIASSCGDDDDDKSHLGCGRHGGANAMRVYEKILWSYGRTRECFLYLSKSMSMTDGAVVNVPIGTWLCGVTQEDRKCINFQKWFNCQTSQRRMREGICICSNWLMHFGY